MNHSVNQANDKVKKAQGLLSRFRKNNAGNFAIMAGAILPVICVGGLYGVDAYYRVMKSKKFNEYVVNACHRAIKPSRTQILEDDDRQATAQRLAEGSFPKGEYYDLSVTTTAGWLSGTVTANAKFKPILKLIDKTDVSVKAQYSCDGIPPYPHDDEVTFTSTFTDEQGEAIELKESQNNIENCFGMVKHEVIGWDGSQGWKKWGNVNKDSNLIKDTDGKTADGEIEVQFWGTPEGKSRSACYTNRYQELSDKATSEYVLELDAGNNNEIWKDMELHPGHYELSLLYYPRGFSPSDNAKKLGPVEASEIDYWDDETNGIGIYLEGLRGENKLKKSPVICINDKNKTGWRKASYNFRVNEYNVYRLYAKAEQINDSNGGLFNSLKVTYLDDMRSKKHYKDEKVVGESEFTSYGNCTDYLDTKVYGKKVTN